MAGLHAEELSNEFLKNFIPETIFLVEGDVPVTIVPETEAATPVTLPQPETIVTSTPDTKETPAIQKLSQPETLTHPAKFSVIGENVKGVAVLVTIADEEFRKLPQLVFLNKILQAIGLQPTDVAYVNNVSGANTLFEDLKQALQVNYILSFASRVESNLPHEKFTLYNPVKLGGVPIVFSHALADLENDQEKKKLLWGALQKTFL